MTQKRARRGSAAGEIQSDGALWCCESWPSAYTAIEKGWLTPQQLRPKLAENRLVDPRVGQEPAHSAITWSKRPRKDQSSLNLARNSTVKDPALGAIGVGAIAALLACFSCWARPRVLGSGGSIAGLGGLAAAHGGVGVV